MITVLASAFQANRRAWHLAAALEIHGGIPGMSDRLLADLPGWSLAWSDEFDGPAGSPADPATWQPEVGGHGWGNDELQYYTDGTGNAALDGASNLAIVVRRPDPGLRDRFGGREYTSARLITKDRVAFSYGLVQARIRLPSGRGIWPAFWMLGQDIDQVGWPRCGEIDVMENFGKDPHHWSTAPSTAPATPAPTASPPPSTPACHSPTTSTCTRSPGNRNGSAGTSTTSATAR